MPPLLEREGPLGFEGPEGFDGPEPPDELGLLPELPPLDPPEPPDVLGLLPELLLPLDVDEPLELPAAPPVLPEPPLPPFAGAFPPDLLVTAPPPPVQLLWPEQVEPFDEPDDDEPLPGPEELPPPLLLIALPPPVQLFWPEQLPAAAWYAGEPPESVRGLGALLAGLMSFSACGLG